MPRKKANAGSDYEEAKGRSSRSSNKPTSQKKSGTSWVEFYPSEVQKEAIRMHADDQEQLWEALQAASDAGLSVKITPAIDGKPARVAIYAESVRWQSRTTIIVQHYDIRQLLASVAYLTATDLLTRSSAGNIDLAEKPEFNW